MVSSKMFALSALAAVGALAAPLEQRAASTCMCEADAIQVAKNFGDLISNYSDELAIAALTPDFQDWSESVNTLINECPTGADSTTVALTGTPTFATRKAFMAGQGAQPAINFEQLNMWYSCNQVTIRWQTTNTVPAQFNPKPVVGVISAVTQKAHKGSEYAYKINTVYSEFDAGAWLENLQSAGACGNTTSS
jgi:hypothetical protein